jgi:putative tricarboxylic transport membrane protein
MAEIFSNLLSMFTVETLVLMMIGTALGVIVGAVPGLTGAMLIALTLPLTYTMEPAEAMVLLVSMYVGAVSGGLITATLLRMPGTPASIMTTLDGYPMAKSGEPGKALGLGIGASFVGGMISWFFLLLLAKPMAELSSEFGPFEFFALVLMALVLIASVGGDSLLRGIFAGFLGMLVAMPGANPATGEVRFTLGIHEMDDGLKLLPVLIGLFAVSQILSDVLHIKRKGQLVETSHQGLFIRLGEWKKHVVNLFRSSVVGTWVGILPGIGANIGSLLAYTFAKKVSKDPEKFGKGSEEGIVASEAANNATVGGALIPLVAMGIPGSVIDAILLGALILHGLRPGPALFSQNPEIVNTIIGTMLLANVFMFVFMLVMVVPLSKLSRVPRGLLLPLIMVFCVIGSYALGNRMFDVWVMLGFGVVGFAMERFRIPLAPFVIGFILAPIAEEHLSAGLMANEGSFMPLLTRPVSLLFVLVSCVLLIWPLWKRFRKQP